MWFMRGFPSREAEPGAPPTAAAPAPKRKLRRSALVCARPRHPPQETASGRPKKQWPAQRVDLSFRIGVLKNRVDRSPPLHLRVLDREDRPCLKARNSLSKPLYVTPKPFSRNRRTSLCILTSRASQSSRCCG